MTLNQLQDLTDDELAIVMHIVNVIDPMTFPKIEFTPAQLVWFRHDKLVEKLMKGAERLKPESAPIFISLMGKLGVQVQYQPPQPPPAETPVTASAEITSSNVPEHIC
jgi:hypothetical protein